MRGPDEDDPDWAYLIRFLDFAGGRVELVSRLPNEVHMAQGAERVARRPIDPLFAGRRPFELRSAPLAYDRNL